MHEVTTNLILDKSKRAVPYAHYIAEGGICGRNISEGGLCDLSIVSIDNHSQPSVSSFSCIQGYYPAFYYFYDNIAEIETKLKYPISDEIADSFYSGLYIDTFSVLELFLSDFVLCGIFSNPVYFDNATSYIDKTTGNHKIDLGIIRNHFTTCVVFHRLEKVKTIFNSVLKMDFPDFYEIGECLYRRNNIVHRYGLANIDRMQVCNAKKDDVYKLLYACQRLVSELKSLL